MRGALTSVALVLALTAAGCGGSKALPDGDRDGIPDRVDNAPRDANAPRVDLNGDRSIDHRDQLDNDHDGIGNPADPDDDGDSFVDRDDLCPLVSDPAQADVDGDGRGDACDPLAGVDTDADGVPDGPSPDDPLYAAAKAAKIKWSMGTTHFVIRIDALSPFFQNEFTQLMTDAAMLSRAGWADKCWENYADANDPPDPCGAGEGTDSRKLTLPGGKTLPVTLAVIPGEIWRDPGVVGWLNDRNDSPLLEIAQHGTYHENNVPRSDWKDVADRNIFNCEFCGLSAPEAFELAKVGFDTLTGAYDNRWIAAEPPAPRVDWASSAHPLLTFIPPFNASDPVGRAGIAQLGFKAFSASVFEEERHLSGVFSPEGSHHEQFDRLGMFHASADIELEPPETVRGYFDPHTYEEYLAAQTNPAGLTVWLIEEVAWSGRPCNEQDRLKPCNGRSNRENDTVFLPRWRAWMQVLDFVKNYPGGVAMTMGEVALAAGFDNAPIVPNPDQADADHDGIGDVIDG